MPREEKAPGNPRARRTASARRWAGIAACIAVAACAIVLALGFAQLLDAGRLPASAPASHGDAVSSTQIPGEPAVAAPAAPPGAPPSRGVASEVIDSIARYTSEDAAASSLKARIALGDEPGAYEPGFVLVRLSCESTPDQAISTFAGIPALEGISLAGVGDGFVKLALPGTVSVSKATALIAGSECVSSVQPNYRYYVQGDAQGASRQTAQTARSATHAPFSTAGAESPLAAAPLGSALGTQSYPNDERFADQWYLDSIGAPAAWDYVTDPATSLTPTTVAVIDSSFLTSHEDLEDNVVASYDAVRKLDSISAGDGGDAGHGTHCAGIIAAVADNVKGIAGVTFNECKVLPVRVSDSSGGIYSEYVVSAYSYLVSHQRQYNIRVASMSLGSSADERPSRATDPLIYDAIQSARDAGILSVAAACNDGEEGPYYAFPSDFDNVISVIALEKASNADGVTRAGYSNYNVSGQMAKNISAPGSSIVSLLGNGAGSYGDMDGTSMAAPVVAGALGLMFATSPGLDVDEATSKLYSTARDLVKGRGESAGWDRPTGFGEADLPGAVSPDKAYLSGKPKVAVGESASLSVKVGGSAQRAAGWKWRSSDKGIARVSSSGKVTGVSGGQVVVTASKGGLVASQVVLVQVPAASFDVSVDDGVYDGTAHEPEPTVFSAGQELEPDGDYTVSYSGNVDAGRASVTIEGVEPYYTGKVKKRFTIEKAELSEARVTLGSKKLAYNGKGQLPPVTVRDIADNKETVLKRGKDYRVSGAVVSGSGRVKITATKSCGNFTGSVEKSFRVTVAKTRVYRLYNPNSSEHLFTASASERRALGQLGWKYEGVAWKAPKSVGKPVYRLYNPKLGVHHYTASAKERKRLVKRYGWKDEGTCCRSFASTGKPVYRLYNSNAPSGQHLFTTSKRERDALVAGNGWVPEGTTCRAVS